MRLWVFKTPKRAAVGVWVELSSGNWEPAVTKYGCISVNI